MLTEFFKFFFLGLAFIYKLFIVCFEVIVIVVGSLASVEINVEIGDFHLKTSVFIVCELCIFIDINLGAIRPCHNRHLLDTATHGCSRNVANVTSRVKMVKHGDEEQIVSLETSRFVTGISCPSKSMTMR